jgi:hypothetical protein
MNAGSKLLSQLSNVATPWSVYEAEPKICKKRGKVLVKTTLTGIFEAKRPTESKILLKLSLVCLKSEVNPPDVEGPADKLCWLELIGPVLEAVKLFGLGVKLVAAVDWLDLLTTNERREFGGSEDVEESRWSASADLAARNGVSQVTSHTKVTTREERKQHDKRKINGQSRVGGGAGFPIIPKHKNITSAKQQHRDHLTRWSTITTNV